MIVSQFVFERPQLFNSCTKGGRRSYEGCTERSGATLFMPKVRFPSVEKFIHIRISENLHGCSRSIEFSSDEK